MKKAIVLSLFLLPTTALAQSFAVDTISNTTGFGATIDSGPGRLSSTLINSRMAALVQDATNQGCTAIEWAGTFSRGRTPRLHGATSDAGTVTGPRITQGNVDGEGFSARLRSGGRVAGTTDGGNAMNGYFARVNTFKSVWYGVETDCSGGGGPLGPQYSCSNSTAQICYHGYTIPQSISPNNNGTLNPLVGQEVEFLVEGSVGQGTFSCGLQRLTGWTPTNIQAQSPDPTSNAILQDMVSRLTVGPLRETFLEDGFVRIDNPPQNPSGWLLAAIGAGSDPCSTPIDETTTGEFELKYGQGDPWANDIVRGPSTVRLQNFPAPPPPDSCDDIGNQQDCQSSPLGCFWLPFGQNDGICLD